MTLQTLLRVGACLKSINSSDDQKNLTWGHLSLVVTRQPGTHNKFSIVFDTPNGKTQHSKSTTVELEQDDRLLLCPIFHLLLIASYAGALPVTHTLAQLQDPSIFASAGADTFAVKFNPQHAEEAIMRGVYGVDPVDWDSRGPRRLLADLSKLLSYTYPLGPHTIRRSGSVSLKRLGIPTSLIQDQLTHARGSWCFHAYVGEVSVVDTVGPIFGQNPLSSDGVDVHPLTMFKKSSHYALSHQVRDRLCGDEQLIDLASSCEELATNIYEAANHIDPNQLSEQERTLLESAYSDVVKRWRELYCEASGREPTAAADHFPPSTVSRYLAVQALNVSFTR